MLRYFFLCAHMLGSCLTDYCCFCCKEDSASENPCAQNKEYSGFIDKWGPCKISIAGLSTLNKEYNAQITAGYPFLTNGIADKNGLIANGMQLTLPLAEQLVNRYSNYVDLYYYENQHLKATRFDIAVAADKVVLSNKQEVQGSPILGIYDLAEESKDLLARLCNTPSPNMLLIDRSNIGYGPDRVLYKKYISNPNLTLESLNNNQELPPLYQIPNGKGVFQSSNAFDIEGKSEEFLLPIMWKGKKEALIIWVMIRDSKLLVGLQKSIQLLLSPTDEEIEEKIREAQEIYSNLCP